MNKVEVIGWIDLDKVEAPKKEPTPIKEVEEEVHHCIMCGEVVYTTECMCEVIADHY